VFTRRRRKSCPVLVSRCLLATLLDTALGCFFPDCKATQIPKCVAEARGQRGEAGDGARFVALWQSAVLRAAPAERGKGRGTGVA